MVRLSANGSANFFFQPLQFHIESADVFKQGRFARRVLPLLEELSGVKERRSSVKQLALPLANLGRMQIVLTSELIDGLGTPRCFQRHLKFEVGAVSFSFG